MKIGYARVSTVGQELEAQKDLLNEQGCEKIFVEKVTGTSTAQRKELGQLMEHVREGDTVYVSKIDRLARSVSDLNKIVNDLRDKGVSIKFIKDNMEFNADSEATNSMQSLMFNMLGSFAQFERDLIIERTEEGKERARQQGKHMGRPGRPKKDVEKALQFYNNRAENNMSVKDIAKMTDVPESTIYYEARKQKKGANQ